MYRSKQVIENLDYAIISADGKTLAGYDDIDRYVKVYKLNGQGKFTLATSFKTFDTNNMGPFLKMSNDASVIVTYDFIREDSTALVSIFKKGKKDYVWKKDFLAEDRNIKFSNVHCLSKDGETLVMSETSLSECFCRINVITEKGSTAFIANEDTDKENLAVNMIEYNNLNEDIVAGFFNKNEVVRFVKQEEGYVKKQTIHIPVACEPKSFGYIIHISNDWLYIAEFDNDLVYIYKLIDDEYKLMQIMELPIKRSQCYERFIKASEDNKTLFIGDDGIGSGLIMVFNRDDCRWKYTDYVSPFRQSTGFGEKFFVSEDLKTMIVSYYADGDKYVNNRYITEVYRQI